MKISDNVILIKASYTKGANHLHKCFLTHLKKQNAIDKHVNFVPLQ